MLLRIKFLVFEGLAALGAEGPLDVIAKLLRVIREILEIIRSL